ncbi:4470_t:CDS:2 [Gigaspora rosea]|nr:4470_t:CDS:2 [Gigaspora rosea]
MERETTLSESEKAQSNLHIEKAVTSITPIVNKEESNQKNDNRSYDQHTIMNNRTKDTMQPMEDDGFIEVTQ